MYTLWHQGFFLILCRAAASDATAGIYGNRFPDKTEYSMIMILYSSIVYYA